jgi:hypothetical protein
MELEGIRTSIPHFIQAIYRVLPAVEALPSNSKVIVEQVQKAAYKLTGALMSSLNRFQDIFDNPSIKKFHPSSAIDAKIIKIVIFG